MIQPTVSQASSAETIGARLKRLRLQRGLSQRDLSSPGVSYAYISRIEAGARTPSVKALRKLSQKLGVSVEYLETGRDIRDVDDRELRLADAELELRLAQNTAEAERKLEAVLDEAVSAGDVASATRARLVLGLVAAHRGNHLDAVERLEAVLEDGGVSVDSRPDVYATLGQSYASLGAPERSVRLFERCLGELGDRPEDAASRIWFATLLSYALTDSGDYEGARDVIRRALDGAEIGADPYSRIRLYWSRARLAGIEGRSAEALDSIREAIGLLKATDDSLHLARAYLMSAGIEASEGNADVAERQLDEAEKLLRQSSEPVDRAMSLIGRSRVAALRLDAGAAVANARAAMDLLGSTHAGEQGAAVWAFARGLALQGDLDRSVDAYHRAVDLLSVHGQRHEAGRAAIELADLLRHEGRGDEAEPILRRAYDLGVDAETASARQR
ncbi:MAG TPA: helix-turn-helix domain-containing protein [Gaiellaceae bacterium]|nr:helix-turn-helix domain-containing protein [Gaiellaceae bacterium]